MWDDNKTFERVSSRKGIFLQRNLFDQVEINAGLWYKNKKLNQMLMLHPLYDAFENELMKGKGKDL